METLKYFKVELKLNLNLNDSLKTNHFWIVKSNLRDAASYPRGVTRNLLASLTSHDHLLWK